MQIAGSICEDGLGSISWWKLSGKDEGCNEDRVVVGYDDDEDDNAGSDSQTAIVIKSSGNYHVLVFYFKDETQRQDAKDFVYEHMK